MAITPKPKPQAPTASDVNIDALIAKGGSVAHGSNGAHGNSVAPSNGVVPNTAGTENMATENAEGESKQISAFTLLFSGGCLRYSRCLLEHGA